MFLVCIQGSNGTTTHCLLCELGLRAHLLAPPLPSKSRQQVRFLVVTLNKMVNICKVTTLANITNTAATNPHTFHIKNKAQRQTFNSEGKRRALEPSPPNSVMPVNMALFTACPVPHQ